MGPATRAGADTTTSTSGGGANVSIVSGNNGGTTIIVDSQHRCRTENASIAASGISGSASTSSGAGGLSGSATAGSGGTSVNIGPGCTSTSSMTSASSGRNVADANECVVIIRAPSK